MAQRWGLRCAWLYIGACAAPGTALVLRWAGFYRRYVCCACQACDVLGSPLVLEL
jgi:hypothetical protein